MTFLRTKENTGHVPSYSEQTIVKVRLIPQWKKYIKETFEVPALLEINAQIAELTKCNYKN